MNDKTAYEKSHNNLYFIIFAINLPGKDPTTDTVFSSKLVNRDGQSKKGVDGGHAFVILVHINIETGEIETSAFGLYPAGKSGIMLGQSVDGKVVDDSNTYSDNKYVIQISEDSYNSALAFAESSVSNPPDYNLYTYNCVDFANDIGRAAGVNLAGGGVLHLFSNPSGANRAMWLREAWEWN